MHTERYQPSASRPASAGASLFVLATVGFGLTLVGPGELPAQIREKILQTTNIRLDPPPPPPPQPTVKSETVVKNRTTPIPHQPEQLVKTRTDAGSFTATDELTPITSDPPADPGPPSGGTTVLDPPRPPVMVGATVDPRYSDALQPPYPSSEIRAQTEGRLVARVLVGVDGRVKAIEILKTPSKGLSEATRRHALARWRFKPATRDGVPYEDWMTMTLNFRLVD